MEKCDGSYGPDWLVKPKSIPETPTKAILQVECKATDDDPYHAIGQCLGYLTYFRTPILLAIPEDFRRLKDLEDVIETQKLQIGLLIVGDSKVTAKRFRHTV